MAMRLRVSGDETAGFEDHRVDLVQDPLLTQNL
jgi:hypothetical protein